ncbi:DUF7373 family lipoprotein [Nocardia crassostreae]|uniref:DUF7373 family lipoprotein n=1 Tax=Nocardia crassostreae TaxID=53428 RepID=UPI00082C3A4E|nr:hypothetical protein [Nocardia crassostreae]
MNRAVRLLTTATCLALTAVLAGCGAQGTPVAGEIDVRTLDAGSYPVGRYTYDQPAGDNGSLLEGMRMAEAVVPTVRVDQSLSHGRGGIVLKNVQDVIGVSNLSSSARPVLENREFLAGFAASGSDKPDRADDTVDPTGTAVTIRLLRFSSTDNAKLAAREIADADFNVALEQNRKLTLPEYPDAFVHWRPGVANIGVSMARKEFVISLFLMRPKAEESDLLAWVKKTLDAEVAAVDAFAATPADKLDELPVDPGRLLARVLTDDRDKHTPDPDVFAVFGANQLIHPAGDQSLRARLVQDTGMDAMASVDDNFLFRTRDAAASAELVAGLIASLSETADNGAVPDNVPDTKCVKRRSGNDYRCYVIYKRYVGVVNAKSEPEVGTMAAAQYALLANSL